MDLYKDGAEIVPTNFTEEKIDELIEEFEKVCSEYPEFKDSPEALEIISEYGYEISATGMHSITSSFHDYFARKVRKETHKIMEPFFKEFL